MQVNNGFDVSVSLGRHPVKLRGPLSDNAASAAAHKRCGIRFPPAKSAQGCADDILRLVLMLTVSLSHGAPAAWKGQFTLQ
jgi:hypothetical protein